MTAAELLIIAYAKNDDEQGSIDWDDINNGQPHAVERGRQCPRAVMLHDRLICASKRDLVRS